MLNEVEYKEQFRVQVSNRITALEDLDAEMEMTIQNYVHLITTLN
jgi:hypothetical protein